MDLWYQWDAIRNKKESQGPKETYTPLMYEKVISCQVSQQAIWTLLCRLIKIFNCAIQ